MMDTESDSDFILGVKVIQQEETCLVVFLSWTLVHLHQSVCLSLRKESGHFRSFRLEQPALQELILDCIFLLLLKSDSCCNNYSIQ